MRCTKTPVCKACCSSKWRIWPSFSRPRDIDTWSAGPRRSDSCRYTRPRDRNTGNPGEPRTSRRLFRNAQEPRGGTLCLFRPAPPRQCASNRYLGARRAPADDARSAELVEAGSLMSYGANFPDLWRRAADFVDKILHGTKPADIPVEQPTTFDLVLNLTHAK